MWRSRFSGPILLSILLILLGRSASGSVDVRYEHRSTSDPFSIHIVHVRPAGAEFLVERAEGGKRETVSSIARRKRALVAVNGSFFRVGGKRDGQPAGVLKLDDLWFAQPYRSRGAIGWKRDGRSVLIDRLKMEWAVRLGGRSLKVDGLNMGRRKSGVVLFNRGFGESTGTKGGIELLISNSHVSGIIPSGNSPIPQHGYVLSLGPEVQFDLDGLSTGEPTDISYNLIPVLNPETGDSDWRRMDFILGGTPVLIRGGAIVESFESERVQRSFVEHRHPRTAVGILDDGTWIFVVVDGRRPNVSIGMTLDELAHFMHSLGCRRALNLDGGGSSTLYLYGQVVNFPSDISGERQVSDAILVTREH